MRPTLSSLFWHDGVLLGISFSVGANGTSAVVLRASLYRNEQAPERIEISLACEGVSRLTSSINAVELKDHAWAGNISDGYLKDKTLWLYLTGGIVEIEAKKFRLVRH